MPRRQLRRRRARGLESLEHRELLAAVVEQVADLNDIGSSRPTKLIEYNGALFFRATNISDRTQWWRLDSQGEVSLVNDRVPRLGEASSRGDAIVFDGALHLTFSDPRNPDESPLWRVNSQGDFEPALPDGMQGKVETPGDFAVFQNTLYFAAGNFANRELWRMGANGEAQLAAEIALGQASGRPEELTAFSDALYFSATDAVHGRELWRLNSQGLVERLPGLPGNPALSDPDRFTEFNGSLYFWAQAPGETDHTLWKADSAGHVQRASLLSASTNFHHRSAMEVYGGALYFFASELGGIAKLWKLDAQGVESVASDVSAPAAPDDMTVFNNELYFRGSDDIHGYELWKINGSGQTTRVTNFQTNQLDNYAMTSLAVFNGALHFAAADQRDSYELWKVDSQGNVSLAADIDRGSSLPESFQTYNDRLYFSATETPGISELFAIEQQGADVMAVDVPDGPQTHPRHFTPFAGNLYFTASGVEGDELFKLEADQQISLAADISPGSDNSSPSDFAEFNGELYFSAEDNAHGRELWKLNGLGEAELVRDLAPGGQSSDPEHLTVFAGRLYFAAFEPTRGKELWSIDADGVTRVIDLNNSFSSFPRSLAVFQNKLYVAAGQNQTTQLWKVNADGAAAAIATPGDWDFPTDLVTFGDDLYMTASTPAAGRELWKIDAAGLLSQVADILPGPGGGLSIAIAREESIFGVLGNSLYFTANDGEHGDEVWRVRPQGDVELVSDIYPGPGHASPVGYKEFNGSLYFAASGGRELGEREVWRLTPVPNDAPLLTAPIADQTATQSELFSFTLPAGTFTDPNAQDVLTLSARSADGSPLPDWLSFDAAERRFVGTPLNGDVGALQVTVTATDPEGATVADTFEIVVADVNDPPGEILLESGGVAENAGGAVVGMIFASDPDAADTLTLSVNDDRFEIVEGQLKLSEGQSLDFETEPSVEVTITAADSGAPSLETSVSLTLTVIDVNEAPTGIALSNSSVAENANTAAGRVLVGDLSASDPDSSAFGEHTFRLLDGGDEAVFEIVEAGLYFRQGVALDFETQAGYAVHVEASDGENVIQQIFPITLTDVLEPTHPWQNPIDPHDVDRDNQVTLGDLLAIVQMLREHFIPYALPKELAPGETPSVYVDVDGDDSATLHDLLVVVQRLRDDLFAAQSEP